MFVIGQKYSRTDVGESLGLGPARGGYWVSGIWEHLDEFYIFPNVGTAGAFGDDFGNQWEGNVLRWYHKKNSHLGQPSVRRLLRVGRAHVFWRRSTNALFEYAGYGRMIRVKGESPVEITWAFDNGVSQDPHPGTRSVAGGEASPLTVGMRASHPRLGVGRVIEVSGSGANSSAVLFLPGSGKKPRVPLAELEKVAGFGPA